MSASANVVNGTVRWSPVKSLWWTGVTATTIVGGAMTFSWSAFALFIVLTAAVLLFGHSLGETPLPARALAASVCAAGAALLARRPRLALSGPCVLLSERGLRFLAGERMRLVRLPASRRLALHFQGCSITGLPALLIAAGSRNPCTAVAAALLLPFATACEVLRNRMQACCG